MFLVLFENHDFLAAAFTSSDPSEHTAFLRLGDTDQTPNQRNRQV